MLKLSCKVVIGSFTFYSIVECSIDTSYTQLIDVCRIHLPRRTTWKGLPVYLGETGLIKPYAAVEVWLGYDGKLQREFSGFVRKVYAGTPVVVECEDDAYILKQTKVLPKAFDQTTLKEVLKYVLPPWMYELATIDDVNLGKFIIYSEVTAAKVLQEIMSQYHLFAFFRDGGLFVGRPVFDEGQKEHSLTWGYNIITDPRALDYMHDDENLIRVKAISVLKDNTKLEAEYGDDGGTIHEVNVNFIDNETDLKEMAKRRYEVLKRPGMRGSVEIFGIPRLKHGDIINFASVLEDSGECTGKYVTEGILKTFGSNGYKQLAKLGGRYEQ